jgi:hypothetical protein
MMLPTDDDAIEVEGVVPFEGRDGTAKGETESWIDSQVEDPDKRNEF